MYARNSFVVLWNCYVCQSVYLYESVILSLYYMYVSTLGTSIWLFSFLMDVRFAAVLALSS